MPDTRNESSVRGSRPTLLALSESLGPVFGSEHLPLILYGLVRMQRARRVVELGTGFGVTSLWLAQAAGENGEGHVWTVDDFALLRSAHDVDSILAPARELLGLPAGSPADFVRGAAAALGLGDRLTLLERRIDLGRPGHFDDYPFAGEPIDLLFSDFLHGPEAVLAILAQFLPRMAPASSLFIDSATTFWPSYLLLERIVGQLAAGRVPRTLAEWAPGLADLARTRTFTLVHLTDPGRSTQNGTAWLKIEPVDVLPHPMTEIRRGWDRPVSSPDATA